MTIREVNSLFSRRLPKGRQKTEIRGAAEIRVATKSLALIILKNVPKGAQEDAILNLRNYLQTVYAVVDLEPLRTNEGN